jgi:hypothetical protein
MTNFVEFEAPIKDFVKFNDFLLVSLINGKMFASSDGKRFYEIMLTATEVKA